MIATHEWRRDLAARLLCIIASNKTEYSLKMADIAVRLADGLIAELERRPKSASIPIKSPAEPGEEAP